MLRRLSDRKTSSFISLLLFCIFASASAFAASPPIASVSFSVTRTVGGSKVQGGVSLVSAAPLGGVVVSLSSDNPAAILPRSTDLSNPGSTVTVEAGKTSAAFTISTTPVERDTQVLITASTTKESLPKSGGFVIEAPVMKTFTLASPTVVGGQSVRGTVTLSGPAPSSGMKVNPRVEGGAAARVPSTLEILSGQSSASFDVAASNVSGDTKVTVSVVSSTGASLSSNLTVTLPLVPELVSMTAPALVTSTNFFFIDFTFDRTLTEQHTVRFTSSNPGVLPLPANSGFEPSQSGYKFAATPAVVNADTPVTITAVSGNSTKTVNVTVRPLKLELGAAASSMPGPSNLTGTLALNLPRIDDTIVTLTANSPAISIPSSLTLPSRSSASNPASLTFDIFSQSVATPTIVTITASSPVTQSKTFQLTVNPTTISSVTLEMTRCDLGRGTGCPASVRGTVTLDGAAPNDGMSVTFDAPGTYVSVPTSILVPRGSTTADFMVSLADSNATGPASIAATSGSGSTRRVIFERVKTTLNVDLLSLSAPQGPGGIPITGTITVKQAVVSGSTSTPVSPSDLDVNVELTASSTGSTAGTFSSSVINVPRGQTTANFTFTPLAVSADRPIEIRAIARGGSSSKSAPFTVTPPSIQSMSLSQPTAQGGQRVTGTIQMTGPVPSNAVSVTSSNPGALTIAGPLFSAGSSSATFSIDTSPDVPSSTPVTLTASFNGQSATSNLTVERRSLLSNIVLQADRLFGGLPTRVRIELDGPAPRNAVVTWAQVSGQMNFNPNQVTVPEGQNFLVVETTPVAQSDPRQLFVAAQYLDQLKQTSVTLEPLNFDPCPEARSRSVVGGTTITCSISIFRMVAPPSGIQIAVRNLNPAVASMPATLAIPAGSSSATFQISTQVVTAPTDIRMELSAVSGQSSSFTITLTPQ